LWNPYVSLAQTQQNVVDMLMSSQYARLGALAEQLVFAYGGNYSIVAEVMLSLLASADLRVPCLQMCDCGCSMVLTA